MNEPLVVDFAMDIGNRDSLHSQCPFIIRHFRIAIRETREKKKTKKKKTREINETLKRAIRSILELKSSCHPLNNEIIG